MDNIKISNIRLDNWVKISKNLKYEIALKLMQDEVENIKNGLTEEKIILLEHPAIYTAGTSAKTNDLLNPNQLSTYKTERGGQWTWHGPGQRIIWPLLNLNYRKKDVKLYVHSLEGWIIEVLEVLGIKGERKEGAHGVWVSRVDLGKPKRLDKIAAIGVRISRWITSHGISINLNPDLKYYDGIIPCGIKDIQTTSIYNLGYKISMSELDNIIKNKFENFFGKNKIMGRN